MTINSKPEKSYSSKSSFCNEAVKESHKGVNNAYDLNRTGHYCGSSVSSNSKKVYNKL